MGSKGGTTTTTQNQNSTYAPSPQAGGYITGALDKAFGAASQPYNIPQAPVAGFSPQQQQAFNLVGNAQGMAQPYYDQASQMFNQSAQGPDISQFFNPYAGAVTAQMNNVFGQQASQNTGQLTQAAGGVGADRIAVGQSQLANQQGLAAGQTLANLYAPSLSAAQQQQQIQQGAAYGQASIGSAAQNSALTGANALLGTGGLQQQLQQAQMNAPYQQQLAQQALPYQQAQFLAGITGSLAPGLGGTTQGQSVGTSTPPAPSIWSQLLGGGTAAAGLYGATGGFGSKGSNPAYGMGNGVWGGSSANPLPGLDASDYGTGYARGGASPYNYDDGGAVASDADPDGVSAGQHYAQSSPYQIRPNGNGTHSVINVRTGQIHFVGTASGASNAQATLNSRNRAQGGVVSYAEGGGVSDDPIDISKQSLIPQVQSQAIKPVIPQLQPMQQPSGGSSGGKGGGDFLSSVMKIAPMFLNRGGPAFAGGGDVEDENPASFDERFPFRVPSTETVDDWRNGTSDPTTMAFAGNDATTSAFPVSARRSGSPSAAAAPSAAQELNPSSEASADAPERGSNREESFASSPWAALMAAGLGIMGGTSPYAGVNIGQGGMQGLKTLESQRAASQKDETIDQAARRLAQEAKQHEDQYSRLTAAQKVTQDFNERKQKLEELKPVQVGQDDYGRPIMMKRNLQTGEYELIKPVPKEVVPPEAPPAPVVPPGPGVSTTPGAAPPATPAAVTTAATDPAALPTNATPTEGLLPSGTFKAEPPSPSANPAALEGMKPADANLVRAIAEGRQQFLPLTRNNPYNRYIMEKVHEYDQNVDQTSYSRRSRTANFFAVGTQGGGGQNIASMNTFGQHADELLRLSDKLNLGQYPTWNAVKNAMAKQGFSDKDIQDTLGAWQVASKAVADEGAKVFAGSNSALADRESWGNMFDPNNPASVTRSKLKEVVKLIEGRLNSLTNQYNEGMRTNHDTKDFIAPRTREIFDRIVKDQPSKPAAAATPDGGGPKVGERKQFKQGWGIWNGKSWDPE